MTRFHYWFKWVRAESRADKAETLLAVEKSKNEFLEKRVDEAYRAIKAANELEHLKRSGKL